MSTTRDRWAEWLAERRFGGDPETRRRFTDELTPRRDKVLDLAQVREGETLLDVGCGEGLIAFGAIERGAGMVIFSDISTDLLDFCREAASELGVLDRCQFIEASADDLSAIADNSVDVVTTRSVLIYVADKRAAFNEFARVLRPGGRISLFEPINRFASRSANTWTGYDLSPLGDIGTKIRAVYDAIQPHESDPMLDFDERDLIRLSEESGFFPIQLILEAEIKPTAPRTWDGFLNSAGNPNIPTAGEAIERALTHEEREAFASYVRPQVEQGLGVWRMASAHVVATKPQSTNPPRPRVASLERGRGRAPRR